MGSMSNWIASNPRLIRRPGKICGVDAEQVRAIHARRRNSGHGMDARTLQHEGVLQSLQKTVAKFFFTAGQRRDAALAGLPVAGRRVKEDLAQSVLFEQSGQRGGWILVREQILDRREAIACSRGKAVKELVFLVHHGQVGGKTRHGMDSVIKM